MDNVQNIFVQLKRTGHSIFMEGEKLRIIGSGKKMDPGLEKLIHAHRDDLVKYIIRIQGAGIPAVTQEVEDLETGRPEETIAEATGEQVQIWDYYVRVGDTRHHQILSIDTILIDAHMPSVEMAVEALFRRHESLRTRFRLVNGILKQVILPYDPASFAPVYVDTSSAENKEETIAGYLGAQKRQLNRLDDCQLTRTMIFKISENSYYLCLMLHHIISDAWSVKTIRQELIMFCEGFRDKKPGGIKPLTMQLRDYALWQKKMARAERRHR